MAVLTFSIVQPDLCTCVFCIQMFNSVLGGGDGGQGTTKHLFPLKVIVPVDYQVGIS